MELMHACLYSDTILLSTLLNSKSNSNYQCLNIPGFMYGLNPLHWTTIFNRVDCVKILLDMGANPNLQDSLARIPLDIAKRYNYIEIIGLLEEYDIPTVKGALYD